MVRFRNLSSFLWSFAVASLVCSRPARADGSETLGPPAAFQVAQGSQILLSGVRLIDAQPGTIDLDVPQGVAVVQVIAYWEGQEKASLDHGPTDSIMLGGHPVTGDRISGPTLLFSNVRSSTYRADVTQLALIGPGMNAVSAEGLDFARYNTGVGLAVIVDDGSGGSVDVRDGADFAYYQFEPPLDALVPQTFAFEAAPVDRQAELSMIFSSVQAGRPSVVEISIDGVVTERLIDVLGAPDWDSLVHPVTIPAGATSITVEPMSVDSGEGPYAGGQTASLLWLFAGFTLEEAGLADQGCTAQYWLWNPGVWDGGCDDVTTSVHYHDGFNETMDLPWWRTGMSPQATLRHALYGFGGFGWWHKLLNRHAAAALANADAGLRYEFTLDEVIGMYRNAVGADDGPETFWSVLVKFAVANWRVCPL